jgi:uncharacterized protein YjiS (DUF1127 family)
MTTRTLGAARPARAFSLPLALWMSLSRNRKRLAKLDAHMLRDIGLTPELAKEEADRPFWDVPAHWRG